ncbi:ankyrin repeat-containing domain protein [Collybia nuda]|uniref:Ankyrin repeat-containing domain protein n=1 Tax=Collybia nuda TaxID=64659 RepID=A0A9P5YAT9_9AGAR|nr:ankyrin repeat-containing domain protein [Collybia nuda]
MEYSYPPHAFCPWIDGDFFVDELFWVDPWHGTGLTGSAYYSIRNDGVPLIVSVQENDLSRVQQHIADGVDVQAVGLDGETALHMAAALGHTQAIVLLLAANAIVDVQTYDGCTPLVQCARFCPLDLSVATADLLLSAGADPMKTVTHDLVSLPPLVYAIRSKNIPLIKHLTPITNLGYVAGIGRTTSECAREALALASNSGDTVVFDYLYSRGLPIQPASLFYATHPATFDTIITTIPVEQVELQALAPRLLYSARSFRPSLEFAHSNLLSSFGSYLALLAAKLFGTYNIDPNEKDMRVSIIACGDESLVRIAIRHNFDITALSDLEIESSIRNKSLNFITLIQSLRTI